MKGRVKCKVKSLVRSDILTHASTVRKVYKSVVFLSYYSISNPCKKNITALWPLSKPSTFIK